MGRYNVRIKRSAGKELRKIHGKDKVRIVARIRGLASDPRPSGSKKLSGEEKYRVRQGDFRILYEVSDETVTIFVVRIAQRGDVYQK
jgi:mRNA interferase RelE/StbE